MVGSVVVRHGEVVGEGYHRRLGGPHGEIEALRAAGDAARGATLYVNLEPCSHHGRTPPCAEAVVKAGIRRVVACHQDPNPRVAGQGFEHLRQSGLEVEFGSLVEDAVRLNWRFLAAMVYQRPAVTLKWAMSLDGRIATSTGQSQWISSPKGRRWGLAQREEHDAILVGSGTALADDPRLDRRLGKASGPNVRVIVDRRLRLSSQARLFERPGDILVYTRSSSSGRKPLEARGAVVVGLQDPSPPAVLEDLYQRGVQSVLVEGGGRIHDAFVRAGCFDRVAVDCAPMLIGGESAPGPLGGDGFPELSEAPRLAGLKLERRGQDVILSGFRERCLQDLSASVEG